MTKRSQPDAAVVTLVIAIALSTLGIYPLLRGFANFPVGTNLILLFTISLSIGTLITSAFYAGLNRGLFLKMSNPFSDPASIIAYIAIVQAVSTSLYLRQRIPPSAFYLAIVLLQSWSAWLMIYMAKPGLNVNHTVMNRLPWAAAISTGSFGILAWPVQNFWPLETLLAVVTVWQTATILTLLVGVWMWFSLHPKFSFPGQTAMASLANRLQRQDDTPSIWLVSVIGMIFQSIGIVIVLAGPHENLPAFWPILVNTIHFYTAASLFSNWYKFSKFGVDKEHFATLAKLASLSAKRMLRRRSNNQNAWAATVGLKTTSFTIDHDPDSQVAQSIPATLLRIRNDEIINMVNQITQRRTLALNNVGQKIIGTIDPEQSSRPCVDALNLFATLYLDAGPIIERRVAGLVSLLPVVNPGLAKIVSTNQIIPLLRKNHWFFHFEFTWVDQSLINTPSATRYGIQMDPVSLETQWALMSEMKKTHSIGNFLWIGKEAHDRLLQEAPHIASIIQPHVMKDNVGSEHIIFAIKFEQLVPRLQRYYDLDDVRSRIIDYEPRQEAQRLLSLLSLQEQGAKTRIEKRRIIDSLVSFNWHGFKEKDQALKLILKIYQQENESGVPGYDGEQPFKDSFVETIRNAVSLIGYPSQILNQAHVYKIELRNIPKLKQHALNPKSPRFEESWVLLSNMSHHSLHTENANLVRDIIDTAMKDSKILQIPFVHAKIIDALIALGRRDDASGKDLGTLIHVLDLVIKQGTTDECLALGLDGANLLSERFKQELNFRPSTVRYFDERCAQSKESGKSSYTSITSRWLELKAIKEQKPVTTVKAS